MKRLVAFISMAVLCAALELLVIGCGRTLEGNASPADSSSSLQSTSTPCLLDPSVAGQAQAFTDPDSRAVTVQTAGQPTKTVLPGTSPGASYAYTSPTLAPDAQTLVVGAALKGDDGSWQTGLWRLDVASGAAALLLASDQQTFDFENASPKQAFDFEDPAFSPDGARIAYTRVTYKPRPAHGHDSSFEIWLIDANGSSATRVVGGRTPRWSNDGRYLAFDTQTVAGPALGRAFIDAGTFEPVESLELPDCER